MSNGKTLRNAPLPSGAVKLAPADEALDAVACSPRPLHAAPQGDGVEEPALRSVPPGVTDATSAAAAHAADVAGRDIWLAHPWALGEPPQDLQPKVPALGLVAEGAWRHLAVERCALGSRGHAHGRTRTPVLAHRPARTGARTDTSADTSALGAHRGRPAYQRTAAAHCGSARSAAFVCRC